MSLTLHKNLKTFSPGLRGCVHLRLRCSVLHPPSGHLRRLRGRQVHEQQEEEDEADQGGKQQREKGQEKTYMVMRENNFLAILF